MPGISYSRRFVAPELNDVSMCSAVYVWIKWLARSPDEIRRETHVAPPAVSVRPTH